MITGFLSKYYGNFSKEELKKFVFLGAIFGFTIGIYWLLRPLKDSIFCTVSCKTSIPMAKWASLVIVIPLAMFYSAIVDKFPRHKIFYALCAIYGTLALTFAYLFAHPIYGLDPQNLTTFMVKGQSVSHHITTFGRIIGWAWYVFVESFGSLMVALFWGFAADTTTPESAKRGFGIVAMGAQIGGIMGPLMVWKFSKSLGESYLVLGAGVAIVLMGFMIKAFMASVPKEQLEGYKDKNADKKPKVKTGLFEGLKLLLSKPYLLSVFAVISIFEIVNTIFDFKLKMLAAAKFVGPELSEFFGYFGVIVNSVALISLLLGISSIGRKMGVKRSLLMLPILVAVGVGVIYFNSSLWIVFGVNVGLKALNYAFNQPTKEQLYVPTTKDTKYKAKAWTEMFGSRGSKAAGSGINMMTGIMTAEAFLMISSIAALGLIGVWIVAANYAGTKHKEAVDSDTVVC